MPIKQYSTVGIGFGPANIALAVALEELFGRQRMLQIATFFERSAKTQWHPGMLLPGSVLQVSFLKDLVTLRNPTSPYTFVNFLKSKGRLDEFANLRTLYPFREEFSQYLIWVSSLFESCVSWGSEVTQVRPIESEDGKIATLEISTSDGVTCLADSVVLGAGGVPSIPSVFTEKLCSRVFHSSEYLSSLPTDICGKTVVVVGSGQSAVELMLHLTTRGARVISVSRDVALRSADDNHFLNRAFSPSTADFTFSLNPDARTRFISALRSSNYGVADRSLLEELYRSEYEKNLAGQRSIDFFHGCEVCGINVEAQNIRVEIKCHLMENFKTISADYVVLATGYSRHPLFSWLQPITEHFSFDRDGLPEMGPDYRVKCDDNFLPSVYLLGYAEHSHGISDTLLSLNAHRSWVIAKSIRDSFYTKNVKYRNVGS